MGRCGVAALPWRGKRLGTLTYIASQLGHTSSETSRKHYARYIPSGYLAPPELAEGEVPADLLARLGALPSVAGTWAQSGAQTGHFDTDACHRKTHTSPRIRLVGREGLEPSTNGLKAQTKMSDSKRLRNRCASIRGGTHLWRRLCCLGARGLGLSPPFDHP